MSLATQALLVSWLPGFFWLAYVESRAPQRSGWSRIALTFMAGAGSVYGVDLFHALVQPYVSWDLSAPPDQPWASLLFFVVVVGLVEESCKLLAMALVSWPRRDFREAWDGLACASAAALGFASAENFSYVMRTGDLSVLLGRFLLATFGHVVMSGFWGYALGLYREGAARGRVVLEALLWSAALHGLYDWCLTMNSMAGALAVFAGMIVVFRQRLQESYYTSRRRRSPGQKVRECRECHRLGRFEYRYCPACGAPQESAEEVCCLDCLSPVPAEAECCPGCRRSLI